MYCNKHLGTRLEVGCPECKLLKRDKRINELEKEMEKKQAVIDEQKEYCRTTGNDYEAKQIEVAELKRQLAKALKALDGGAGVHLKKLEKELEAEQKSVNELSLHCQDLGQEVERLEAALEKIKGCYHQKCSTCHAIADQALKPTSSENQQS